MLSDQMITHFDKALRTLFAPATTVRPQPGGELPEADLSPESKAETAALMRVNHCGEICAQALYQGQAITARDESIRAELEKAAAEETEHLAWTERRIEELGGRKSLLNPLWYAGSLALGMAAGRLGDRWNLGFLAETERQVENHLQGHLERIAPEDVRTQAILAQMKEDEIRHAATAEALGGGELPAPVRGAMKVMGQVMTTIAHRI
ncbi:MAG TPA: 2-polyprenyl-3-methyl-6-methoxy-1,4-benzoquinone monooxygenase [Azoarcus sp.]|nr:2-polyprenyl-3-methyl-6-methoxy-1,4-benzoquinone monooxygenase [Azoarcus sp.]